VITSADRCRNCNLLHRTDRCPSYGPMFPAPGKTKADYQDLYERIQNQLAADILAEHYGHPESHDDDLSLMVGARSTKEKELKYRTVPCTTCDAPIGESCTSRKGGYCNSHAARVRASGDTYRERK
jgi:hypothetical protein